jgi:Raf kinase inhibitor-like YbhB/YbcL family protein
MIFALITIFLLGQRESALTVPALQVQVEAAQARKNMALHVSSNAFSEGQQIPQKYTCDGQNLSPPLRWEGVPQNARSVAVLLDDPDAPSGTFTHWILYDLPGKTAELKEGSSGGGKEGVNSFKNSRYDGPCPPPNGAHRYFFHVYALDIDSLGKAGLSQKDFSAAMRGHVLAESQLIGTYKRAK